MEYKNTFPSVVDEINVPNKFLANVEKHYRELIYIDIVRVTGSTTKTVNKVTFKRTPEGHPEDDALAICEAAMHALLYSASEDGLATYRAFLFTSNNTGGRPRKISVTFNKKEVAVLLNDESGDHTDVDSTTTVQEASLEMVKEAMAVSLEFSTNALNGQLEQNRELHDRLLEHSRNSTIGNENLQQLVGSLTEQVRDAAVQKDRALGILHTTKIAEIEAESSRERVQAFTNMMRVPLMMAATQLGDKFGITPDMLMTEEEKEAVKDEQAASAAKAAASAASATSDGSAPSTAEAEELAKRQAEIRKRIDTEPVVFYLEQLKESLTPDQWLALDKIRPAALMQILKDAFEITDEEKSKEELKKFGALLTQDKKIQEQFGEILDDNQRTVVSAIFQIVVGIA